MEEIKYYDLTPSQEVVKMQTLFSLDKRIINILSSATFTNGIDVKVMKKAINEVVKRNDCLQLRFVKKGRKLMQYFDENATAGEIPVLTFKTEEEQNAFLENEKKKPIAYKKGVVIEFKIINTFDRKQMVFVKLCHYILDTYGLVFLYNDLHGVYNAMKDGKELPPMPGKFEEIVKKDLIKKNDKEFDKKNREYFSTLYLDKPEPYYAGIHGLTTDIAKKYYKTRSMKMFLICNNKTKAYMHETDSAFCDKIMSYCKENKISPANLLFFASSLCQARMNNNTENILQLELCNCRPTAAERNCAGTKVQSLGCYVHFDWDKTVEENFKTFMTNQNTYYRHLGFSDFEFQSITHKVWHSSQIKTYYAMSFSFVPMPKMDGIEVQMYNNGKFALPCYFACLFDMTSNTLKFVYDAQIKLTNEEHVKVFHNNFMGIVDQIIDNNQKLISEIKIK